MAFNRGLSFKNIWGIRYLLFYILRRIMNPSVFKNILIYIYHRIVKSTSVSHMPYGIMVEASSRCNYECSMCKRSQFGIVRVAKDMSYEEFKKIINELGDYLIGISFWNYGEPLMNKDILQMISHATRKRITTVLSTNGLLLNEIVSMRLIEAGLKYLIIGVDGTTQDIYEKYRRGGDLNAIKNNIRGLLKTKDEKRSKFPVVDLQLIVMRDNEKQIADFFTLAKELKVNVATLKRFSTLQRYRDKKTFIPTNEELIHSSFSSKRAALPKVFCETPWRSMVINSNGDIVPCCSDFFSKRTLGNAFNDDIKKIWTGKEYTRFRFLVKYAIHQIDICTDCPSYGSQEGSFIVSKTIN